MILSEQIAALSKLQCSDSQPSEAFHMFAKLISLLVYSRLEVCCLELHMYDVCVIQNIIQVAAGKP